MEDLFNDDVFEGELPIWFVVGEGFVERDAENGQLRLTAQEPLAFCGGMVGGFRCIAAFTDGDLAEQHSMRTPQTAPVAINDVNVLTQMLNSFYPTHFHSIIFDPGGSKWTKNRKPIPEFIASIQTPKKRP